MLNKINTLFLAGILVLISALNCNAADVLVTAEFAYNGTAEMQTKGFKLFHKLPDGTEVVAADIADANARKWSGVINVPTGRSVFSLASYSDTEESGRSKEFPFEYIEPVSSGLPTPTVIIRFN